MTTADARLRIEAETRQAETNVTGLHSRVTNLGSAFGSLDTKNDAFGQRTKAVQERVEKFATAVSSAGSVLGGMGSQLGAVGGAASGMLQALMAGGPALATLTVGATAAAALTHQIFRTRDEARKAASDLDDTLSKSLDKARQAAEDARDALVSYGKSSAQVRLDNIRSQLAGIATDLATPGHALNLVNEQLASFGIQTVTSLKEAQERVESLTLTGFKAAQFGMSERDVQVLEHTVGMLKTADQAARSASREREALLQAERDALEILNRENEDKSKKEGRKAKEDGDRRRRELEREEDARIASDLRMERTAKRILDRMAEERQRNADKVARDRKKADDEAAREARQFERKRIAAEKATVDDIIGEIQRQERFRLGIGSRAADANIKLLEADLRSFERYEKAKTYFHEKELNARQQEHQQAVDATNRYFSDAMQLVESQANSTFDSYLTVVDKAARGQKVGLQEMAAEFVKNTGKQLAAIGIKYIFEGGGMIMASGGTNGWGYATAALGAGAFAVGAAMATTGTVMAARAPSFNGGGGGGGRSSGTGASSSSPRRRRDNFDPAMESSVVFNLYGSANIIGPTASGARNLQQTQNRARRRHLARP